MTQKAVSFKWAQNSRRLSNRSRLSCYLNHMIWQIQSGLKMLTVDRDAVCILWQIPIGELHTAQAFGIWGQNPTILHK